MAELTTDQVWKAVEKELFAIIGMVTAHDEARTAGIVYVARNRRLYIATGRLSWKARHMRANAHVSITIPVTKRLLFLPWIRIPSATITFSGTARLLEPGETTAEIRRALLGPHRDDKALQDESCFVEVVPRGDFVTYGIGVPLLQMRDRAKARGRAPVALAAG